MSLLHFLCSADLVCGFDLVAPLPGSAATGFRKKFVRASVQKASGS